MTLPQGFGEFVERLRRSTVLIGDGGRSGAGSGVIIDTGGPLANAAGDLVGLNAMIAGGLGLAVPGNALKRFAAERQSRETLGVSIRQVRVSVRGAAVILLADDTSPGWTGEAMAAGAKAVLPRSVTRDELAAAVRAAAAGLIVIHPDDLGSFLPGRTAAGSAGLLPEPLTPREQEVLLTMAAGLSNKEIASHLGISDHTVKFHVASIMGKLGATSRTEAVMIAVRAGLVMV